MQTNWYDPEHTIAHRNELICRHVGEWDAYVNWTAWFNMKLATVGKTGTMY